MPHCPRWLYEKLLERNEDHLNKMILLSNDLSLYAERWDFSSFSYATCRCWQPILTSRIHCRELRAEELKKIPKLRELGRHHDYYFPLRRLCWRYRSIGNSFQVFTLPEYEDRPDAFNDMAWQWTACSMHERSQLKDIDSRDVVSTVDNLAESVATLTVDTSNGRL